MKNDSGGKWFIRRPEEFKYLIYMTVIVLSGFALGIIHSVRTGSFLVSDLGIPARFLIACILSHLLFVVFGFRGDMTLLPIVSTLAGFGLMYQYRLGHPGLTNITQPAYWIYPSVPLIVALTAIFFRHNRIVWLKYPGWLWVFITPVIPLMVVIHGHSFRGGLFGPGHTTPTEFVKPLFLIATAWLLTRYGSVVSKQADETENSLKIKSYIFILSCWIVTTVLFLFIRDLGMILALTLLLIFLLSAALGRMIFIIIGGLSFSLSAALIIHFLPKGFARFEAWLEPFKYPDTYGYQIIQSLFALFHGAFLGRGIGWGLPHKIPLVESDLIYAAISEETGLLGGFLLLAGLLYIGYRGIFIASQSRDAFSSLITVGASAIVCIQVFLNVGGAIKLIPLTGVPLPFISHGGSALITFSWLTGIILSASDPGLNFRETSQSQP